MLIPNDLEDKKKFIITSSKDFNKFEHIEIFKILKIYHIKYSENSNGIFVNLNYLTENIINKIIHFISFCHNNKETLNLELFKRNELKKIVNVENMKHLHNNIIFENQNDSSNTNYDSGFSYNVDNYMDNNETYYKENTFIIPSLKD
jgi:Leucine-rich repeat (LRR) protein